MLSILHRRADGSEFLFEAETIEREQPEGEICCPAFGKFVARGLPGGGSTPSGGERWLEIEQPFGAVFVMNESGATVARYTS